MHLNPTLTLEAKAVGDSVPDFNVVSGCPSKSYYETVGRETVPLHDCDG